MLQTRAYECKVRHFHRSPIFIDFSANSMQVKYLLTKQSVVYHCNVKHCITRDNIPVVVRATVVLRIRGNDDEGEDTDLVRKFAYGLGVRGLETQLANAVVRNVSLVRLTSTMCQRDGCVMLYFSGTNYLSLFELYTFSA